MERQAYRGKKEGGKEEVMARWRVKEGLKRWIVGRRRKARRDGRRQEE